jgi:hypothetical protein
VVTKEGTWQEGDSFFLLTDAIAQGFLRAARDFANLLTTYPGSIETTYQAYETALGKDVVGGNFALVTQLVGLSQAPAGSFVSHGTVASTAVVQSSKSQAELYVLLSQAISW